MFFGYGCVVLPGVAIGSNCVVGAGAVVSRDIPEGSVAVGVPAKVIGRVEDYVMRSVSQGHPTKFMEPKRKREFYKALLSEVVDPRTVRGSAK